MEKVVASSTSSGDVLVPQQKEPPWTHTIAGRAETLSPVGWYMSSCNVTVLFSRLTALPYLMLLVTVTALKIGSRYRTGAVPSGAIFGQSHPAARTASTAKMGSKTLATRIMRSWSHARPPSTQMHWVPIQHSGFWCAYSSPGLESQPQGGYPHRRNPAARIP